MAEDSKPAPHSNVISLAVAPKPRPHENVEAAPQPKQLALELDRPKQLVIVVTDKMHGATFLRCLFATKPRLIVDLRFAPHFNFTAIDSATVRRQLDAIGARYVQHAVPFHELNRTSLLKHDPTGIAKQFVDSTLKDGAPTPPIMVLIKEGSIATAISPYLIAALSTNIGGKWSAEFVA